MMIFDRDTCSFDALYHFASALVGAVERLRNMVVVLLWNYNALTLDVAVPFRLLCINKCADLIGSQLPADLVEKVEFKFRQDEHGVSYILILHILNSCLNYISGIVSQRSVIRIIDYHGVTRHR